MTDKDTYPPKCVVVRKKYNEDTNECEYSLSAQAKLSVPQDDLYVPEEFIFETLRRDLIRTINERCYYEIAESE